MLKKLIKEDKIKISKPMQFNACTNMIDKGVDHVNKY